MVPTGGLLGAPNGTSYTVLVEWACRVPPFHHRMFLCSRVVHYSMLLAYYHPAGHG